MSWHSLPLFVRIAGRPVIVLGDGEAAEAKRRLVERAGGLTTTDEAADARLAIVAIADEADAGAAVARLKARGVLVNAVDRPALCDFTLPAIVDRDPVLIAIGTGGVSAGLAAALRQALEGYLSPRLGRLARYLFDWRPELRRAFPDSAERRRAIARALKPGGVLDLTDPSLDDPFWIDDLKRDSDRGIAYVRPRHADPDELTLREARLLAVADRVFHRPDVPVAILNRARADAARVPCPAHPDDPGAGLSIDIAMAGA